MEITGILHTHSTYSYDAKLSLTELRDLFVSRGLSFACMTEHVDEMTEASADAFVKECRALSDSTFTFVPGFEVPHKRAHILMIGCERFFGNYAATVEALQPWVGSTSFVVLAHPVRNRFVVEDALLSSLDAIEVWNQQYEGKRVPRTRSLSLLRHLREKDPLLLSTGGVDFHRTEHLGGPFVTLEVGELAPEAILEKLKTGAYRIHSPQTSFYGTAPNVDELIRAHRFESAFSVAIIVLGKTVNTVLAAFGISLPKSLKRLIRRKL